MSQETFQIEVDESEALSFKRVWRWMLLILLLAVLVVVPVYCYQNFGRKIPLVISAQTMYYTAPLTPTGGVDTAQAINQEYFSEVPVEENLLPLLWEVIGVNKEELDYHDEEMVPLKGIIDFANLKSPRRWTDIEQATTKSLTDRGINHEKPEWQQELDQAALIQKACQQPFVPEDFPAVAAHLEEHRELFLETVRFRERNRCEIPCIETSWYWSDHEAVGLVFNYDLGFLSELCAFAMLQLGEGQTEAGIESLLTTLHLSQVLYDCGHHSVTYYLDQLFEAALMPAVQACCEQKQVTPEMKQALLAQLQRPSQLQRLDRLRLWMIMKLVQNLHDSDETDFWGYELSDISDPAELVFALPHDPNTYNQVILACFREFEAGFKPDDWDATNQLSEELVRRFGLPPGRAQSLFHTCSLALSGQQARGRYLARWVISEWNTLGDFSEMLHDDLIRSVRHQALATWVAASMYRDREGAYPAQLADLVPAYLAELPQDPFTHEPLHYEQRDGKARIAFGSSADMDWTTRLRFEVDIPYPGVGNLPPDEKPESTPPADSATASPDPSPADNEPAPADDSTTPE